MTFGGVGGGSGGAHVVHAELARDDAERTGANFNKVVGRRWRASAVSRCASAPSFRCAKAALTRRARMNASEVAGTYKRAYKAATTSPLRPCSAGCNQRLKIAAQQPGRQALAQLGTH